MASALRSLSSQIIFKTRVFHPAIDAKEGKVRCNFAGQPEQNLRLSAEFRCTSLHRHLIAQICGDYMDDAWKPSHGIRDALVLVRNLLADPHGAAAGGSAVNQDAVKALSDGLDAFEAKVAEEVSKYASG